MRRARIMLAITSVVMFVLVLAPAALARADGGQGFFGETTDKDITSVMFIVIAGIPVLILLLSLIQNRLEKRKHAREDAARARAVNADWRGGW